MSCTLYVSNVPWSCTDDDLAFVLAPHCAVVKVRVIRERTEDGSLGKSKGFGFADVDTTDVEALAASLDGQIEMADARGARKLAVKVAKPRSKQTT